MGMCSLQMSRLFESVPLSEESARYTSAYFCLFVAVGNVVIHSFIGVFSLNVFSFSVINYCPLCKPGLWHVAPGKLMVLLKTRP